MQNSYAPDNTRTSILVMLGLAVIVSLAAVFLGLSEKPQVDAIGISAGDGSPGAIAAATQPTDEASGEAEIGANSAVGDSQDEGAPAESEASTAEDLPEPTAEREIIVIATPEPTPTPEVAAAVEPTPVPEAEGDVVAATTAGAPSMPLTTGTIQGAFFTKSDENDGAVVAQNEIILGFAEDGSGDFRGLLDITYGDNSRIVLNMSGPLTWAPTNPQVETTLAGLFTLDALIAADDVTADDAELSISSLEAGSGSLCISNTKCFGFTFPPQ